MATIAISGNAILAAGTNAASLTVSQYDEVINQAEGQLIADTGVNWVDSYASLNADFKQLLQGAVAALAGNSIIRYDMSGFPTLNHAITTININLDKYDRAVAKLKEMDIITKFGGTKIT